MLTCGSSGSPSAAAAAIPPPTSTSRRARLTARSLTHAPTNVFENRRSAGRLLGVVARVLALLFVALAVTLVSEAQAQPARASGVIPQHGVFVVGKTLAGVGLGYTQAQVKAHSGAGYTVCTAKPQCSPTGSVWLFVPRVGEPLGVGVRFRNGKTVAVFTLGTPGVNPISAGGGGGWKTAEGLGMFDSPSAIYSLYPAATISTNCIFYGALSMRQGGVTSSFYLSSGTVYGFALTAAGEPICE